MRDAEKRRALAAYRMEHADEALRSALPQDFSRWLHDGFNERQDADYGTDFGRSRQTPLLGVIAFDAKRI